MTGDPVCVSDPLTGTRSPERPYRAGAVALLCILYTQGPGCLLTSGFCGQLKTREHL